MFIRAWGISNLQPRHAFLFFRITMTIDVLIFGAGAIGAFYGSRIAQNPDTRVSVVCRSNYNAVKANGFSIQSPQLGTYDWRPFKTFPKPEDAQGRWNYIVVSTKALPDVSDDSALLEGLVQDGTNIVLIQNGLGVEEPYHKRFPRANILSAVTIASCSQPEHGKIKHHRWTRINVGPYKTRASCDEFVKLLKGIKDGSAYTEEKMQLLRWHKIAINAAMNPSSVLSGGTDNATMSKDSDMSEHLMGVMKEVLTTAQKVVGKEFPSDFATAEQILRSTQKNPSGSVPSMQQDWEGRKKMELEVILGAPIRLAKEKGVEMPRLQTMYALIKMKQKRRDERGSKL
jgi:2-dehydropantoate 2-reductase